MNGQDPRLTVLLGRIARQDERAMAELLDATRPQLIAHIRRLVRDPWSADEVLQDVYRQVWCNASAYSRDRGTAAGWLHMIARSRALDVLRQRRQRDCFRPLQESDGERRLSCGHRDEHLHLRRAFAGMPAPQRALLRLAFVEGYSHSEIAREMELPLGTVKTRIRAALRRMRESLSDRERPALRMVS
jgi:RNA polymerase sigma-70 factor (ECF subfamily)